MKTIDLRHSSRIEVPLINNNEARQLNEKGWSLSYTYYLSELRDVYLALKITKFQDHNSFTEFCKSISLPFAKTRWDKRRVLEYLNALKNFSLVGPDYQITKRVFNNRVIGSPLTQDDLNVFREIYFDYFRFKEIFSWFIDPSPLSRLDLIKRINIGRIRNDSKPLFAFSENGKFMDSFIYDLEDSATIYSIRRNSLDSEGNKVLGGEDLMRFWDVFIKWGLTLKVIEKFSLKSLGIEVSSAKNLSCCYIINENPVDIDLVKYVDERFSNRYIYLPQLVFDIATEYRLSLEKAQTIIIDQYRAHREYFSFERTSEIFVKRGEIKADDKILFPKYNDAYISHMVVRR